ncbi:hypothetical protein LSCM1_06873 [Leishmania martiniquensis]|nr:hypothetical protein LSCM1_06873 [Leishmania martiniquensis]
MHERAAEVAAQRKRRTRPERLAYSVQMADVQPERAGEVREAEADTAPFLSGTEVRDPYYEELMALRASLMVEGPKRNADKIRAVEEQMKDRAVQLRTDDERAAAARVRVRDALLEQYPLLPKEVHGIPLEELPLRDDDEFVDAEQEHARLATDPVRNAEPLRAAEERMRERAEKLADVAAAEEEALRERLPFVEVGKVPCAAWGWSRGRSSRRCWRSWRSWPRTRCRRRGRRRGGWRRPWTTWPSWWHTTRQRRRSARR